MMINKTRLAVFHIVAACQCHQWMEGSRRVSVIQPWLRQVQGRSASKEYLKVGHSFSYRDWAWNYTARRTRFQSL